MYNENEFETPIFYHILCESKPIVIFWYGF